MSHEKPLGIKAYGHIPHFPGSRVGPGDHRCDPGQARICCEKARDRHDEIIVQEKVDGACVAVACVGDEIVALGRAGYRAETSPYEHLQLFAAWVREQHERFRALLRAGERLAGEWLALAHGTRYSLPHEPFVAFDLMVTHERLPYDAFVERVSPACVIPRLIHRGTPLSVEAAALRLELSGHGALDPVEGAVWRVQRKGAVDFVGKWVRPDKVDGAYLPEISGQPPIWNWRPTS